MRDTVKTKVLKVLQKKGKISTREIVNILKGVDIRQVYTAMTTLRREGFVKDSGDVIRHPDVRARQIVWEFVSDSTEQSTIRRDFLNSSVTSDPKRKSSSGRFDHNGKRIVTLRSSYEKYPYSDNEDDYGTRPEMAPNVLCERVYWRNKQLEIIDPNHPGRLPVKLQNEPSIQDVNEIIQNLLENG